MKPLALRGGRERDRGIKREGEERDRGIKRERGNKKRGESDH